MKPLEGVMALTYTPFNEDFTLNEDAVRQEIDWVIKQGATGIWPGTYAGQWPEMDETVRKTHGNGKPIIFFVQQERNFV